MTPAAVVPEAASSSSTANATSTANAPFFSTAPININLRACLRGGFPSDSDRERERERRRSGSGRSNSVLDERERSRANTNVTPHRRRKKRILWRRTNSSNSGVANVPSPGTSNDNVGIINGNGHRREETSGRIGGINLLGRGRRPSSRATNTSDAPSAQITKNDIDLDNLSALNHHRSAGEHSLNSNIITSTDPLSPARGDRSRSAPPASRLAASVLARASFRSNSSSSALPPRPRKNAALRRVREVLFERAEPRFSEDLRSTKRRIIQVSRQSNLAPAQCRLGFRSRTGWEPIRAVRENQDCLVALLPWGPQAQYCLFGVLDGHGRSGHFASLFIAQRIVSYLLKALKQRANKIDVSVALFRAFLYAEQKLESSESKIDCTLSGSTSVFCLIDRSTLYCANVGDSRAVLGRRIEQNDPNNMPEKPSAKQKHGFTDNVEIQPNGTLATNALSSKYTAVPLSFDHKPSRPDEKARIEGEGGRVDAWQSCDVGAERVWLKDSRTPGLAVTRSFGDYMVKNIGVNSTPEIYSLPLSAQDSFIVLGSDGVYEFLSNEEVVNIVGKHREDNGTPQNAAEEVVKISAERWMDDDTVIDDISCIVVFLEVKDPKTSQPLTPNMLDVNANSALEIIQTPASSRMSSIRPNSNQSSALFGQFSTTSSASASRQTSNGRLPVPLIRPQPRRDVSSPTNTNTSLQNSPPPIISASAVNDAVRKYARKLAEDTNGDSTSHRVSITREEVFGTKVSSSVTAQSIESADNININVTNTVTEKKSVTTTRTTAKRERESEEMEMSDEKAASIGSDTEMYDDDAVHAAEAAVLQGHVSDGSSRFGDADDSNNNNMGEEHIGPLRITQSMSTKVLEGTDDINNGGIIAETNIYVSDEEDEDKYADADTLVPIDNQQKVVRRREVETHRRRLREVSTPNHIEKAKSKQGLRRKESAGVAGSKDSAGITKARQDSGMGIAPRKNSAGGASVLWKNSNNNSAGTPPVNANGKSSMKRQASNNRTAKDEVVRLPSQQQHRAEAAKTEETVSNTNSATGNNGKEGRFWFSRNLRSRRGNKTPPTAAADGTINAREDTSSPTSRFRR